MKVYVSEQDREKLINDLSLEVKEYLYNVLYFTLEAQEKEPLVFNKELNRLMDGKVCELEGIVDIEYLPEKLTFFTFNNLRCQQDGVPSEVKRFGTLQEALQEYNSLPKEYTTALGGYLGETNCIDFIHRRNGESVLVNDFKKLDDWANNGLVKQAIGLIVEKLGVEYESDISTLGYQCPVLVPFTDQETINAYFDGKFLRPRSFEKNNLLSAINEVFVENEGWVEAKKFFNDLNNIEPSKETYRPKVAKYNVNYVDLNGHYGQADISPADFALLKKQTEERLVKHPEIDVQIKDAAAKSNKAIVDERRDCGRDDR